MSAHIDHPDEIIATKGWDTAVVGRLWRCARPHARRFAASFLVLIGVFAAQIAGPWMLRGAIDGPVRAAGEARIAAGGAFDPTPYLASLGWWAAGYLAVILAGALFRYGEIAQLTATGQAVIHDLRTRLFAHIQRLDLAWFDRRPIGSLVTRVTSDIENLNELFTSGLIALLFDLVKIAVVLGLLFGVSVPLATLVLLLTPLLIGVSMVFRGGARSAHRTVRAKLAKLNGYLQEVLNGIRVVQVFRREERVSRRFAAHLDEYFRANLRTILLFALFFPIIGLVVVAIQGAILWRGGGSIASGELSPGDFILFWFWLQLFVDPIRQLGERYNVLQSAFASAERIFDILDTAPGLPVPAAPRAIAIPFRGHVRFEGVTFAYGNGPPAVEDLTFEIPTGHTVALVGATGAGKSTIVNLLLRFYDPRAGRIAIDGVDLAALDLAAYRAELGIVLQEDFLFSGSVRENLALGRARVGPESLARALEAAAATEVVARIPGGLDGEVAERGVTLSTGERELLAIARALAADPRLVILDEATSSVDSATEARIEEATHQLLRHRSALVVAHRLSTVRRADRILVMHHGRLREAGTHAELLAQGGIYARLHSMQFRDLDDPPGPAPRSARPAIR
ncbi:MAG: ABC transporter ATP-binding protein [Planctomycetota bacterium]